ncbi:methylamine dehydrogenase accessory protein MauD [Tistlia consotensis]|uniref:Methylamine dehydrogenase accessory protein MauD n=1 Tax=Tistlia consotensis USBA 355 TaxID=560819 RepID=A0A1Y6B7Q0_9PROT|nr:redoxin domain-containing protein [Tistlia consotensis]SME97254.1 methylamine dehydrogenase accessory protein MauD [Tistlia consotensis USBA 355]SNR56650.1 methylamine dehydrogenase accessory protein MauD [Tistlia consotensis]
MTVELLSIAVALLAVVVVGLLIVVLALARQVGVLFERVAPMGALITDSGPAIGESVPRFELTALDGRPVTIGSHGGLHGGAGDGRSQLLFFLSPDCPVCKKLLPVLKATRAAEAAWLDVILASDGERSAHERFVAERGLSALPYLLSHELGVAFRVGRLPFALLLDGAGVVRAKGLVNNREQLDSLFTASELGTPSIQHYLDRAAAG